MLEAFQLHVDSQFPFLKECKLLLAMSGGIDSVVLTSLCNDIELNITLAHCNFKLRGKESDVDESFVIDLGEKLDIEVFTQSFDTKHYALKNKLSTQMAARELRYQWFDDLCEQLDFDFILTAHHADDNLETFLINLSRGTGIEGLTGIPEVNGKKVRPLLKFSRNEIENYAKSNNLKWREDKSNSSKKYLRNKLRHEVVPILKEINPQLLNNFRKTVDHLKDSKQIIEDRIDHISDDIINVKQDGIYFNISKIEALNSPRAYLYELLKSYGFTEWDDVHNLLSAQSGKQIFSEGWRLLKDREELILVERNIEKPKFSETILDNNIVFENGVLLIEEVNSVNETNSKCIYIDADTIKLPLTVRTFAKGDVFYPNGMNGKKKISKYFKDEKMSLVEKENTFMLCSGENIVWVINKRVDRRFKVSDKTKNILKISLTN